MTPRFEDGAPLTARSVVASLLLGMRRPCMGGGGLVRSASLFGIAEGTTRVALSRMVAAGELRVDDGEYSLAGELLARHARQDAGRRPTTRSWDGTWRLAVVGTESGPRRPAERTRLRRRLERLRLAEWREGVWARPDNLGDTSDDTCAWISGCRMAAGDDAALAARLWDLDAWIAQAALLVERMGTTAPSDLGPAFVLAAAVVRHLRDDPLLPPEILPSEWPGPRLRADYDTYEREFQEALRRALPRDAAGQGPAMRRRSST